MKQNTLVLKILNYIDDHLYTTCSVDEISCIFHYNKDYIMRIFKKELKLTIIEYIQKRKIYLSLNYLENTKDSILKVSLLSGFASQEYYTEIFKKIIGVSPSIYRKFITYNINISWSDIKTIQERLIIFKKELDFIDNYKIPIISKKTLSLSVFKKEKTL